MAKDIEKFGAEGITVHPRPDERHIRKSDVTELKKILRTEFNIEGYPTEEFIAMVLRVRPDQVTLVPDPPDVLTSNAGWDVKKHKDFLSEVVSGFRQAGIRTSIFIEPDLSLAAAAAATGTDRVELYTEWYASQYAEDREKAVKPYREAAIAFYGAGLGLNAGHDLNLHNLKYFREQVPELMEVSIGHAIICDALYYGMENTVQMYLRLLKQNGNTDRPTDTYNAQTD